MTKTIISPETLPALAPCPFCGVPERGGEALLVERRPRKSEEEPFRVLCAACGTEGPRAASESEAHELWNRRAAAPKQSATPANPLIDSCSVRGTLENVAAMVTWQQFHPLEHDCEDELSETTAGELALADGILRDLMRDAVRYAGRRAPDDDLLTQLRSTAARSQPIAGLETSGSATDSAERARRTQ